MASDSAFGRAFSSLSDSIQDTPVFQQLKAKWDEQPERTRAGLVVGSMAAGGLILLATVFTSWSSVDDQRQELERKLEVLQKIQLSQEELRRLRNVTAGPGLAAGGDWTSYFQGRASESGVAPEILTVTEKRAEAQKNASPNSPEETLVNLQLKGVNIRQLVKFVYNVENGPRTAKVRNLLVDTQPDESGYLDVTVAVSGFTLSRNQ